VTMLSSVVVSIEVNAGRTVRMKRAVSCELSEGRAT
jgi:hypothetical protein